MIFFFICLVLISCLKMQKESQDWRLNDQPAWSLLCWLWLQMEITSVLRQTVKTLRFISVNDSNPKVLQNWPSKAISLIYLSYLHIALLIFPNKCQTFHLNNSFPLLLKCIVNQRLLSSTCAQINHLALVSPHSVWESWSWVTPTHHSHTHTHTEVWIF